LFNYLKSKWIKPNGISVLISAQNEQKTIALCVESFLVFADEIIIVTNGSTDNTISLCQELQERYPDKIYFYNMPELRDLYHNRAYALKKAKFRWIFRGDADYVAYKDEDGKNSIRKLRHIILNQRSWFPQAFLFDQVNVSYQLHLCRDWSSNENSLNKIPRVYGQGFMPRVYLNTPLLKFKKQGQNEGAAYFFLYKKHLILSPYWFHLTLNSDKDLFLRSARREWREKNEIYKTLEEYILKEHIPKYYPSCSFLEAQEKYISTIIKPSLVEYKEDEYFKYPKSIRRLIHGK
jgi:glycosyltransferase involved in cell wall biosynthesis